MTFDEFEYICHYYQPTRRSQLAQRFTDALFSLSDTREFELLLKDCHTYLQKEHDVPIQQIHVRQKGIQLLELTEEHKLLKDIEKEINLYRENPSR